MTLYEVFDKIAERLLGSSKLQGELLSYFKDSMDDDGEFTRSRYQKRPKHEGPIENRELGNIQYIICGCTKPFHPSQIKYDTSEVDLQAEIIWDTSIGSLEEDKELLEQSGYEHQTIIILNQEEQSKE